jgi:hypothetical protein
VRCSIFAASLSSVVAAALVACGGGDGGGGGNAAGDPCSASKPCGDGLVCDLTDPAGAACIDAEGDLDGDGIPNAMDKCQHVAGGQFDEDGDGIGDECDACPIAKPAQKPDTDHDGVDAPCDPNPDADGDKIVLFNGFNTGAIPDGWTPSSAAWTVVGGEAIMTPTTTALEQLVTPITGATQTAIFTAYRIDTVDDTTTPQIGLAGINKIPQGNQVDQCGAQRAISGEDQLTLLTNGGDLRPATFDNGLFNPAGLYQIVENLQGATADCALAAPTQSKAVSGNRQGLPPNQVALQARGGKIRFEYLLVVQSSGK